MNKPKRVLVTGGAGFIGSHLVDDLIEHGHYVDVLDTLADCYSDNLWRHEESRRLQVYKGDVSIDNAMEKHIFRVGFTTNQRVVYDEIYHLAGLAATPDFVERPVEAFEASVMGISSILKYAQHTGSRVLFTSSSEVYGDAQVPRQDEEYRGNVSIVGPRSGYDEGKRGAEALIAGYRRQYGVNTAVVRIFNTIGPRMMARGRLVPTMVLTALRKGKIIVCVPGSQTRTLLDVSDCVRALKLAMAAQPASPVNVGGTETLTVLEVASMIKYLVPRMANKAVEIVDGPQAPDEVFQRIPVIRRAQRELHWHPEVPVEDSVKSIISYWLSGNRWSDPSHSKDIDKWVQILQKSNKSWTF